MTPQYCTALCCGLLLYGVAIFLSAFLLFQVQPVIAKAVLPWFGGSSAVWTTCMLFFQLALLAGYGYAHWLSGRRAGWKQAAVHSALLLASLLWLPVTPAAAWKPAGTDDPAWRLLGLLCATVGLPYFLLSATTPLLQHWYARGERGAAPYRLFAVSNLASMLALLSYPPLVEPSLSTSAQARAWSGAYLLFAVLCAAIGWRSARRPPLGEMDAGAAPEPGWRERLLWIALAACPAVLLLATTNFLTQDVAAVPFLWIVPLSVYLLSFILCFESRRLYPRRIYLTLLPFALAAAAYRVWPQSRWGLLPTIGLLSAALFVCSMVCHGELAARKPHPRRLTAFYLMVAAGGALGGLFCAFIAPRIFAAYHEFPVGLGLCAVLPAAVALGGAAAHRRVAWGAAVAMYVACLVYVARESVAGYDLVARNFYGKLAVYDDADPAVAEDAVRRLVHGAVNHGQQPLRLDYRRLPVSYFCPESGIGRVLKPDGRPRSIGILGLGCGTLAAYGRRRDTLRMYEINPLVIGIARTRFSYLRDSEAQVEVAAGDARLTLEREPARNLDVLVMDAFSGDSVPVHLLTREAFRTYFRHLKPDGLVAVNISNAYLDLRPVIERAAYRAGMLALLIEYEPGNDDTMCFACTWAFLVDPRARGRWPGLAGAAELRPRPGFREWTDDYTNILGILK